MLKIEDKNRENEVADLDLMTNEEKETLHWVFKTFNKFDGNTKWKYKIFCNRLRHDRETIQKRNIS